MIKIVYSAFRANVKKKIAADQNIPCAIINRVVNKFTDTTSPPSKHCHTPTAMLSLESMDWHP
jgi:hypothetical protein